MLLQISNISKSFDGTDILSDCSFHIEENEKYSKNYIDYKDPAKQVDGKLLIKTREELIPTTNDIELMKKQKNKQPIDYSILSPYLKGIIKDLKEKE